MVWNFPLTGCCPGYSSISFSFVVGGRKTQGDFFRSHFFNTHFFASTFVFFSEWKICNRCPHVGAGGLTSGGMPEREQFLASLENDKKWALHTCTWKDHSSIFSFWSLKKLPQGDIVEQLLWSKALSNLQKYMSSSNFSFLGGPWLHRGPFSCFDH